METLKTWIKNLWNNLEQKDKMYHIAANFIMVLFIGTLFGPAIGLGVSLIASLGKEIYDEYRTEGTGWDWADLLADIIGMTIGLLIIL